MMFSWKNGIVIEWEQRMNEEYRAEESASEEQNLALELYQEEEEV
jgi:hypothetical protein